MPNSSNPLIKYVAGGSAPMTQAGLVVDGVYPVVGIINSLNTSTNTYQDPNSNSYSYNTQVSSVPTNPTKWVSSLVDDFSNNQYNLDFIFNRTTYLNTVKFRLSSVPCMWTLSVVSGSTTINLESGIIDIYKPDQTNYVQIDLDETYTFDPNTSLNLQLIKSQNGIQYSFTVQDFTAGLTVQNYSDVVISGTPIDLTVQNSLGFVEEFVPQQDLITNIYSNSTTNYWKSSPQPVKDAVVYFVIDLESKQTINKMYLDPLFSGNSMNLYYSNDNLNWSPVQRDFTLRRGVYDLPTIYARYLKLEFSQLTPEPYDLPFDTVNRTIQVFPDWVDAYFISIESAIPDIANQGYLPLNTNPGPNVLYNSSLNVNTTQGAITNQLSDTSWGANPNNTGSTNVLQQLGQSVVADPTTSYKTVIETGNFGSTYNYVDNNAFINRRFPTYCQHIYKNVNIAQTWHQAYFAGIKKLSFYNTNLTVQNDYEEFTDYFLPSGPTIVNALSTTATLQPSGGYTGTASQYVTTKQLKTISEFKSFKIAALSTDWQSFLADPLTGQDYKTLLYGPSSITNVTISGASLASINTSNSKYGIYTISGSTGVSSLTSDFGGSTNLLTAPLAFFTSPSGWSGSATTSTVISGLNHTTIPIYLNNSANPAYGLDVTGINAYSASVSEGPNLYSFLVRCSGLAGSVNVELDYYSDSTLISGMSQTFTVAASGTNIVFTVPEPYDVDNVNFKLTPIGGTATFSEAGYFYGIPPQWSSPLITNNMRVSAVARIFLPYTNQGTYRCSLISSGVELAHKTFSNIPIRTWVDIEVPFTLQSTLNAPLQAKLTQSNGAGEAYEVAMLGLFYNPTLYQYSIDGSIWYNIQTNINDPNGFITLPHSTNSIYFKATFLEDATHLSALSVVPNYTQNAYSTQTNINYLSDIKTNELSSRRPASLKPLFQLSQELHPNSYDIRTLMQISNPYQLD